MALGTINLTNSAATSGGGYLLGKVEWSAAVDAAANESVLTAVLYCRKGGSATDPTSGFFRASLTLGGVTESVSPLLSIGTQWVKVTEKTVRVTHSESGSGSCVITASVTGPYGTLYANLTTSGTGTAVLDTIARASEPTATAAGWKMGQTGFGIRMNRKSTTFYHKVRYAFGSLKGQTAGLVDASGAAKSDGVGDLVYFVPPRTLGAQIPNALSGVCTFTVTTYRDAAMTQQVGSAKTCTAVIYAADDMLPTVTEFAVEPVSDGAVKEWGIWVQSLTRAGWRAAASGSYGSSIKEYTFSMGTVTGNGLSGQTAYLPAGSMTPKLTVRDSRGRSVTKTLGAISVLPYSLPVLRGCTAFRCDGDGTENDEGTCIKICGSAACTSLDGRNRVTLRHRIGTGAWETTTDGTVRAGFAMDRSYTVEFSALDTAGGEKRMTVTIPVASATLHLREGGKGAAFGKYCEADNLLDIAWDSRPQSVVASGTYDFFSIDEVNAKILEILNAMPIHAVRFFTWIGKGDSQIANGIPFNANYWRVTIHKGYTGYGVVRMETYGGYFVRNIIWNGVLSGWEWINPPMAVGVEYRTTERYLNKPVYVKVINFGALPNNSSKVIAHGLTKTAVVDLYASSTDGRYYFPSKSSTEQVDVYINLSNIMICATGDWSSVSANVVVKYTKD